MTEKEIKDHFEEFGKLAGDEAAELFNNGKSFDAGIISVKWFKEACLQLAVKLKKERGE